MSTQPDLSPEVAAWIANAMPTGTDIPHGHFSEGQARLIAGALTGDTGMIRQRLDAIAADDE